MALTLVTAPTLDPVPLADLKHHLQVLSADEDSYITALGRAATEWCEVYSRQTIYTTTLRQTFPCWPADGVIELYRPPLASVTSVQYVDGDGATQTLATSQYVVDTDSKPGRVLRGYGITWPTIRTQGVAAPVTVVFVAGHTTVDLVPESFKHAIKLIVGHWFENRESTTSKNLKDAPQAAKALLSGVTHGAYP